MKLTACIEMKIFMLTFKNKKKTTKTTPTKHSCFWMLRTRFHSLDFSWTSSVSWIRCILAFYQGIHVNDLVKTTCLRGSSSPTSSPVQFLLCKYGDDIEDKMAKWKLTQVWWAAEKNCACLAGVVQLQSASVALYSSHREKKGRFVQNWTIPSLARSHKKASEWLSFNIYSVSHHSGRGPNKRPTFSHTLNLLLFPVSTNMIMNVGGGDIWFLLSAPCSGPHSSIFLLASVTHHVMKFLSGSLSSPTTNPKVWCHLSW